MAQDVSNRWILLFILFIALTLAVVGFATPNWYRAVLANTVSFTAGLFDVCVSTTCFTYLNYLKLTRYSGDYVGCVVFHVFGIALACIAILLVICYVLNCQEDGVGLRCYSIRRLFMYVAWLSLFAGVCLLVTVIWFYIAVIRDGAGKGNLAGAFILYADYSLGLTAAAGGILIIVAFFLFFFRNQMYDEEMEYYQPRPKMALEPVYRPPSPEPVRRMAYEKPVYSRTVSPPPITYRVEQPRPKYTMERPAPVRIAASVRPPSPSYAASPKTYRYTTAEEPPYASRATYVERRY
ncbi:uncharacterized protein LOC132558995 [Ylistrum balloti]|uniref:uncharacterized protein LOC132558995 n=1 Tax=Ylistrum balloti TaxID=509963 RepID=UPI00290598E1|nr:uncharacterized protein LOC132558995 [Ylistrum balloti]